MQQQQQQQQTDKEIKNRKIYFLEKRNIKWRKFIGIGVDDD